MIGNFKKALAVLKAKGLINLKPLKDIMLMIYEKGRLSLRLLPHT